MCLHVEAVFYRQDTSPKLTLQNHANTRTQELVAKARIVMCRYNMTRFAMMLNEITPPGLERKLAPTDCRLRPDQHALEEGIYDQVINCAPAFASPAKQPFLWYEKWSC